MSVPYIQDMSRGIVHQVALEMERWPREVKQEYVGRARQACSTAPSELEVAARLAILLMPSLKRRDDEHCEDKCPSCALHNAMLLYVSSSDLSTRLLGLARKWVREYLCE